MGISASRAKLSLVACACLLLAACGGGGDESSTTANDTGRAPVGESGLPASPPAAGDGTSANPNDGAPTGSADTPTGSTDTPPSDSTDDPSSGPTDGATDPDDEPSAPTDEPSTDETPADSTDGSSDEPPVVQNSPPTIGGTPPPMVLAETPYLFVPITSDADGDILHFSVANLPRWAAFEPTTGRLEGTPASTDVGTYEDVRISVTDGADDAHLEPFSITVTAVANGAVELSWVAPTENVDGSPLTDLAGYKIYWGTRPDDYPNSVTIDNPAVVTYVLEGFVPGTYYFVATAFNAEGTESEPSAATTVTIS